MASKRAAKDWLEFEIAHGRGDEPCHVIDIRKEEQKRIKNDGPKPITRFQMECDVPEAYTALHIEKQRIADHCRKVGIPKAIWVDLMARCWREGLDNAALDKIAAALEVEGEPRTMPPRAEIPSE